MPHNMIMSHRIESGEKRIRVKKINTSDEKDSSNEGRQTPIMISENDLNVNK